MSSNIPTRRPTRATRPIQGDENKITLGKATVVTRATRLKPALGVASASTVGKDKPVEKSATTSGTADTSSKRKRDALGEVTNGKGPKSVLTDKKVLVNRDAAGSATTTLKPAAKKVLKATHIRKGSAATGSDVSNGSTAQDNNQLKIKPVLTLNRAPRRGIQRGYSIYAGAEDVPADDEPVNKKRRTSPEAPSESERPVNEGETRSLEVIAEEEPTAIVEAGVNEGANVKGWFDIDEGDHDDPSMVSEYAQEIFEYLLQTEQKTLPKPNYMEEMQRELAWNMRGILVDFLIQLHSRYRMQQETLFLTVNVMDRFLSLRECSVTKFQLVGCAAFFIASKCEETVAPSLKHLVEASQETFTDQELVNAERYILKTLNYDLNYPNPLNFLRRASKADDFDVHNRTLGKFLLEIGVVEWRLVACPPSLLAAAAMWIARLILGHDEWTPTLEHYTTYSERALLPTANLMLNFLVKDAKHETFWKKYASKKYMKASLYCRAWALEHWKENERINLAQDLPWLKAEARERMLNKIQNTRLAQQQS